MNRSELIDDIAENTEGVSKRDIGEVVDAFTSSVSRAMQNKDKLTLVGFGSFEAVHRDAKTGRNPATGESLEIDAKDVPVFKAAKALKELVNNPPRRRRR